jgi:AAA15 family ATPase/GTPase
MFVEFSVENYRSIQEKQTFSMVASEDEIMLESNTFPMPNTDNLRLLTSAVIYGANASGKSNLLRAMQTLRGIVINSATKIQPGEKLPVDPFRLNKQTIKNPTKFEVIFINNGIRYEYGVSLNRERVYEEWLIAYPHEIQQTWFSRKYMPDNPKFKADEGYKWSFGRGLKGEKLRIKRFVRSNSLFLSHAAQNNHPQLTEIFEYFQEKINIIFAHKFSLKEFNLSINMCEENEQFREQIVHLLKKADIGISNIRLESQSMPENTQNLIKNFLKQEFENQEINNDFNISAMDVITIHKMNDDNIEVEFSISDESDGTQRLFEIAGYWLYILQYGEILIVDELDRSLHPILSKFLLKMLNDPEINKKNAQLIFATHDTTLLDSAIFRRDQVWFTEKDKSMTKLYSLVDFQPREHESLQKGYLLGRYGAVPFINGLKI